MLNKIELNFIAELNREYLKNHKFSFMNILFGAIPLSFEEVKKEAIQGSGSLRKLLKKSTLFLSIKNGFYLGKHEDDFFIYSSEGELFGAGKEIQNTCCCLRNLLYFSLEDKRVIDDMFARKGFKPYDEVIKEYDDFCKSLNLCFQEKDDYWEKQAEDFNNQYSV
ncbi:hypothetical protein [Serratia sp. Se-RSBMAAmG]|uniref:hypothetical protein n=1 Tax=Serratia sp. Se-RSBMAAmG TaxID=3043305 RepID=UPI0024AF872E|nr:hypothetical protein [Serratia sp. Se-RSBMAAmG]MDI6976211.1 hypothetical protein [Serratia sp. Se-RSBMAAmG]